MRRADYELPGTLASVTSGIREGGTGNPYAQGGTRKCAAARADQGTAIAKGSEVVVRFEQGIAYVRRWDDFRVEVVPKRSAAEASDLGSRPPSGSADEGTGGLRWKSRCRFG